MCKEVSGPVSFKQFLPVIVIRMDAQHVSPPNRQHPSSEDPSKLRALVVTLIFFCQFSPLAKEKCVF